MNLSEYIQRECAANSLQGIVRYLLEASDPTYYADRHIAEPPQGWGLEAACSAGLALLREWTKDAASLGPTGLVASKPILIIDQEWLADHPDAPPPHVLVTLAKDDRDLPTDQLNATPSSKADCPCGKLLIGDFENITVLKIEPSTERESLGGWLFRFDVPLSFASPTSMYG